MQLNKIVRIGEKDVKVGYSSELEQQSEWLLSMLSRMSQSGILPEDGKRFQLGWSMLVFRKQSDEVLVVCEPDFKKNPFINEVSDVSVTLKNIALQNEFAKQAGVTPVNASFQDKIIIEKGCLGLDRIYMNRIEPVPEKHLCVPAFECSSRAIPCLGSSCWVYDYG
jgi:hypothetical protein